jgi:hypothetical protein
LDEEKIMAYFHQTIEKDRQQDWHEKHIKKNTYVQGDQALLYDIKYQKNPGKLNMHWLGSFMVEIFWESRDIILEQLNGVLCL